MNVFATFHVAVVNVWVLGLTSPSPVSLLDSVMVTHSSECAAHAHRQIHLRDGRVAEVDEPISLVRGREPLAPGLQ